MSFVPLTFIPKVINDKKESSLINIGLSFVNLCNLLLWLIYGVCISDIFVMLPNIIGIIMTFIVILFYYWGIAKINNKDTP